MNFYWENVKDGKELKGGMRGHHATGGLQLLLDNIDTRSAFDLEEDYGIENTYLTIGATHSIIDDFGVEMLIWGDGITIWDFFLSFSANSHSNKDI